MPFFAASLLVVTLSLQSPDHGRVIRVLMALWLCLALAGCDLDSMSAKPISATCSEIGAQCQLVGGPLGVCQQAPCDPGATPPCFKCTAQH